MAHTEFDTTALQGAAASPLQTPAGHDLRPGMPAAHARTGDGARSLGTIALGLLFICAAALLSGCSTPRATGDLGVVIARESGELVMVERSHRSTLETISGLGDLSHASVVYSRDERFAYVFGRDGGLTKVDLLRGAIEKRIVQAGNSIGGAISQDGSLIAVANYQPGGLKIFDADTLAPVADIPAVGADGRTSKVVGIADIPGNRFVYSLFESGEIWIADARRRDAVQVTRFPRIGREPYDALVTPDGRWYLAGLFGEDGIALLDLWHPEKGVQRVLDHYGRGEQKLPVYKMPHLRGWALAGNLAFLPAIGRHEVLVARTGDWSETARIPVHGQPVFAIARPDARQVWVNFAFPDNDTVQVIDTDTLAVVKTFKPGKGVLHMEFAPRGNEVWLSLRDEDRVEVYDTASFARLAALPTAKPSGIFFTTRAHRMGM